MRPARGAEGAPHEAGLLRPQAGGHLVFAHFVLIVGAFAVRRGSLENRFFRHFGTTHVKMPNDLFELYNPCQLVFYK